uniref:Voltage-dependent T-type calcium channel subunit alpha-1G-like n=1 Tax=Mastacembelus armatus TaxID=205130 RepID=A0A7N8Y1R4_9TELE
MTGTQEPDLHEQHRGPTQEEGDEEEEGEKVHVSVEGEEQEGEKEEEEEKAELPYPSLAPVVLLALTQTSPPRSWCLRAVCHPYPSQLGVILAILLNCVTLGMFQPCGHTPFFLQALDDGIFVFFAGEMVVKMVALGVIGQSGYLGDTWNRLDFFIVIVGMLEYSLDGHNVSLSAIRTVRVLRPLRAINRVPSMRILVTLLLDTLPMLGNVLALCFFVFFIFGIVGVQLWAGLLRNRCFMGEDVKIGYYRPDGTDDHPFICSTERENGMLRCSDVPRRRIGKTYCFLGADEARPEMGLRVDEPVSCVNWYQYYNQCRAGEINPHKGAINFDNIGYAWIAIFQVITLEGWADIMYYVMDAHSFYNFIYFIFLIIVGSFFMINLCLVVIATQFSETKQREHALMKSEQHARQLHQSASTLASDSQPGSCYEEIIRYLAHLGRKAWRRLRLDAKDRDQNLPGPCTCMIFEVHVYVIFSFCVSADACTGHPALLLPGEVPGESSVCPYCTYYNQVSDIENVNEQPEDQQHGYSNSCHGNSSCHSNSPCHCSSPCRGDAQVSEPKKRLFEHCWAGLRTKLELIVGSRYFNRGIMIAILINTLSMGIEYHEQPQELTDSLEISNMVFTSLFSLEMLLKLLALGLFGYIKNPYNGFDSVIVIISVWEIVGEAEGGLSVLRTFRLLRVLKLVRFLPALRRQLVVLMKTMDNVATFCMLLMLFIFIFSILGMHLFGCKFGLRQDSGDTLPDRKNFDSLLWATVTVFQILTQEDWNAVLYNGMASTSALAALYFVALMTFGNYVLFNLLVAILVEGFQAEVRAKLQLYLSYLENKAWRIPIRNPTRCYCCLKLSSQCAWDSGPASRRSSWTSIGRAPSLHRKSQSGEMESLLSDTHTSSNLSSTEQSLDQPEYLQVPMLHPFDCNGTTFHFPDHCYDDAPLSTHYHSDQEEEETESLCKKLKNMLEPYEPQWCLEHEEWSLYVFSPQNRFRLWCQRVISHKMFDHIVLLFIFLNCITIALERPDIQPNSMERVFLSVSNYIFTVIFVGEMMIKVVAMGLYFGNSVYLQSSWNILDGLLVFVSLVDILVSVASAGGNRILGILRVLRLLRTLRPLRVISRAPGLKLVVETLITSLRPIGNIVLICCAFFIVFGILGVQLFKGKFFYCDGLDVSNITNKTQCLEAGYRWVRRKYNFDNLGQALMSLFVLSCKDGWVSIMYDGLDAVAVDQQPIRNHNPWMLLFFISFLLIVSFFVLNMFVGVVVENFHKCRQQQEEEEARLREEKRQRRLEKRRRRAQEKPYYADYSPLRRSIHTVCTSQYLDLFITIIIFTNLLTMSMEHYNQPQYLEEILKYCNYVFTLVFVIEAILKLIAFGLRRFFKERWNQLDLAIVLLSIMGITLEEIDLNASLPINPTIIRIMRVLRITRVLKLLKMATGMRALLDTVMQALPQVGNLGLLFMLLFFIYAALGVELFGKLECSEENPCEGLSRHATFDNFGMAFLTLFRVSTGDNWNGIMKDTLRECRPQDRHCLTYLPLISPVYFVTFVLTAQFVLVNVVVAVLMKHLEESNKEAQLEEMEERREREREREREEASRRLSAASVGGDLGSNMETPAQVPGALPAISHATLGSGRSSRPMICLRTLQSADRHSPHRLGPADSIDGHRLSPAHRVKRHRLNSAHSMDGYKFSPAHRINRHRLTSAHSMDGYRLNREHNTDRPRLMSSYSIDRHHSLRLSPTHSASSRPSHWLSPEDSLDKNKLSPSYVPESSAPKRPASFRTASRQLRRQVCYYHLSFLSSSLFLVFCPFPFLQFFSLFFFPFSSLLSSFFLFCLFSSHFILLCHSLCFSPSFLILLPLFTFPASLHSLQYS